MCELVVDECSSTKWERGKFSRKSLQAGPVMLSKAPFLEWFQLLMQITENISSARNPFADLEQDTSDVHA